MTAKIGSKEAQRRALRESVRVAPSLRRDTVLVVPERRPHEDDASLAKRSVVVTNLKAPFDRKAYQRAYMRKWRAARRKARQQEKS